MTKDKVLLLDGNSLAYRAFFALPPLTNDMGVHTNATYGFTMMLNKIIEEEQPTKVMVAFDAGKTTFRHESYSEYKGGRAKTPQSYLNSFRIFASSSMRTILNAMNYRIMKQMTLSVH